MNTLNQRDYYRIFTGPDQSKGFENIFLGYEAKVSEQTLLKDSITTFHFPYFASNTFISESGLIEDGATAGSIPAVADKIYSQQKGYGEVSPWGDTRYLRTGELHYTWLFSQSGESPVWIDRYYNPGSLSSENMLIGDYVSFVYNVCSEDSFIDRVSDRIFEPGVMYQYYHVGERYAQDMVATLSGSNELSGLRLHFNEWTPTTKDASGLNNTLQIKGDFRNFTFNSYQPEEVDRNFLNLNTPHYVEYRVLHDTTYNNEREFSLACWIKADDWGNVITSQIAGNAFNGGYHLGFNNFKHTPTFFIASSSTLTNVTSYSNLFCFNQNFKNYTTLDFYQSDKFILKTLTVDGDRNIVSIDSNNKIQKFDHLGNSKRQSFQLSALSANAFKIFADSYNHYYVTTTKGVYKLDNELLSAVPFTTTACDLSTHVVFDFLGKEHIVNNSLYALADSNNNIISLSTNNELYINGTHIVMPAFINDTVITGIDAFTIDPEGDLWLSHCTQYNDTNGSLIYGNFVTRVSLNYNIATFINTVEVGAVHRNLPRRDLRQISIIYNHSRLKLTTDWYVVHVSDSDKMVHFITQDFFISSAVNLLQRTGTLDQLESNVLDICNTTDFIGYEWDRVSKVVRYNNTPQLTFKMSMRNVQTYAYRNFEVTLPYTNLKPNQWHHVCVTYKDNNLKFYLDTLERSSLQLPYTYFVDYKNCNSLYLGVFSGSIESLNSEIRSPDLTYNGCLDDLRIYNYALPASLLVLFNRSYFKAKNMVWNIPTSPIQYVEGIERFFQHKIPGNKSQFYKIKIEGFDLQNVSDEQKTEIQTIIEKYIYDAVEDTQPSYTELFKIEWA